MSDRVGEAGNVITRSAGGALPAARERLPRTHEPANVVVTEATLEPVACDAGPGRPAHASLIALSPAMPAEVHPHTGDHSPLSYLSKPPINYFSRALRKARPRATRRRQAR
ncbi:MAG: hypothetical protein OXG16_02950 [Rhodospirillales bacterium]|nr:hypothetical protein [Rhodospirillales bacterium]